MGRQWERRNIVILNVQERRLSREEQEGGVGRLDKAGDRKQTDGRAVVEEEPECFTGKPGVVC